MLQKLFVQSDIVVLWLERALNGFNIYGILYVFIQASIKFIKHENKGQFSLKVTTFFVSACGHYLLHIIRER